MLHETRTKTKRTNEFFMKQELNSIEEKKNLKVILSRKNAEGL